MVLNDADARMSAPVIYKTVPEFLNDNFLGFTQHTTKTLDDQRNETYYMRMLQVYTDFLYQGHFLLSSIMGCHPPLVGHSVFLRSDAIRQVGRIRTLRSAQKWLKNIGLPFLGVDQIGFKAVTNSNRTEYWSECHVSEDFELMIHLYNLGYKGRYVAFKDCEFQEGVTRTFDEEAGRHRKFALGAHELMFNTFQDIFSKGLYSSLFKTFLKCDIPSYYKVYLTAYLQSYMSGGVWYLIFTAATILRLTGGSDASKTLYAFSPVAVLVLVVFIYYLIGYVCFLIALCRMRMNNPDVFFPEYRKHGCIYICYKMLRFCMSFQFWFYSVMGNYFFLGGMDHMLAKPGVVGATNKDSIDITTCSCLWDIFNFNWGSYLLAWYQAGLAFCVLLEDIGWDITFKTFPSVGSWLYAGPGIYLSIMAWIVPTLLNPYVCPCTRPTPKKLEKTKVKAGQYSSSMRRYADAGSPPPRPRHTRKPSTKEGSRPKQQSNGSHHRPTTSNGTRPKRSKGGHTLMAV
jgi:hypothetical protein